MRDLPPSRSGTRRWPRRARADAESDTHRDGRVRPQHQPNVIVIAATNRPHILSPTSPLTYIYLMWVIAAAMLAPLVLARYGRRPWRRVDVSFVAMSFKTSGTLSQDRMSPPPLPLKLSPGHVVLGQLVVGPGVPLRTSCHFQCCWGLVVGVHMVLGPACPCPPPPPLLPPDSWS